jgi:sec-independent protein translocase protein TatA
MSVLLGIFGIGTTELMILAVIMLLLFGNRLPGLMRSLGRGVVEFKRGVQGIDEESEGDLDRDAPRSQSKRAEEDRETAKSEHRGD